MLRRIRERIIEGSMMVSSIVTSLAILLIVYFLFSEGFSIFGSSPVKSNYSIVVNVQNPVSHLNQNEIKKLFDHDIENWREIGGKDMPIRTFTINDISEFYSDEELGESFENVPELVAKLISENPGMVAFVADKYVQQGVPMKQVEIEKIDPGNFLLGKEWFPTTEPAAQLGVLPLVLGTLWVSLGAILIALPFGLATAIYMAEIADPRVRALLKPIIELLAGIPSVVYGFFGLVVIVPLIKDVFGLAVGETALAGSIILGIMALPTIITLSEDALRNTPRAMKEASLALGATKWQTIAKVVVPYSLSGITTAAILGIGRAIGETMAVLLVTGNAAVIPTTFLEPVRTIPATIAAELGESPQGGIHYEALFMLGCILFLITFAINLSVEYISARNFKKS